MSLDLKKYYSRQVVITTDLTVQEVKRKLSEITESQEKFVLLSKGNNKEKEFLGVVHEHSFQIKRNIVRALHRGDNPIGIKGSYFQEKGNTYIDFRMRGRPFTLLIYCLTAVFFSILFLTLLFTSIREGSYDKNSSRLIGDILFVGFTCCILFLLSARLIRMFKKDSHEIEMQFKTIFFDKRN